MPSFSRPLEETLHRAVALANARSHEYATLEHLLLALTEDPDALAVMRACGVNLDALTAALTTYIDHDLAALAVASGDDAKPTAGFQRVIQRAVIHVQSSGREEVSGANVLVAIFSERESHAAYFLQEQDMSRYDAVNYIAHGIAKKAGQAEPRPVRGASPSPEEAEEKAAVKKGDEALAAYCIDLNAKAREGKVDPLIGRRAEVERSIQILCRRTKNNPLLVGDPGVGKTEVAKQLAGTLGIELLRFDMSEYMERHTVSRLIGAPPGYVGHDQGGLLTDAVGKKVDFRNVVLIMTTNAGAADNARASIGFGRGKVEGEDDKAIQRLFTPEFRNRLDAVVAFKPLTADIIRMVVRKFIGQLQTQLADRNVTISLSDEAADWLAENGFDELYGARPLGRVIQEHIKQPLADDILFGRLTRGGHVDVVLKDGKIAFEIGGADEDSAKPVKEEAAG